MPWVGGRRWEIESCLVRNILSTKLVGVLCALWRGKPETHSRAKRQQIDDVDDIPPLTLGTHHSRAYTFFISSISISNSIASMSWDDLCDSYVVSYLHHITVTAGRNCNIYPYFLLLFAIHPIFVARGAHMSDMWNMRGEKILKMSPSAISDKKYLFIEGALTSTLLTEIKSNSH